mmetsp:Transcript_28481/g.88599  ORF Transcript_28481/g.88599 Transcript_28481/m.88599 type:complete len:280 (+) Transcript_28481:579-1418(+)
MPGGPSDQDRLVHPPLPHNRAHSALGNRSVFGIDQLAGRDDDVSVAEELVRLALGEAVVPGRRPDTHGAFPIHGDHLSAVEPRGPDGAEGARAHQGAVAPSHVAEGLYNIARRQEVPRAALGDLSLLHSSPKPRPIHETSVLLDLDQEAVRDDGVAPQREPLDLGVGKVPRDALSRMAPLPTYRLAAHPEVGLLAALQHDLGPAAAEADGLGVHRLLGVPHGGRCVEPGAVLMAGVRRTELRAVEQGVPGQQQAALVEHRGNVGSLQPMKRDRPVLKYP